MPRLLLIKFGAIGDCVMLLPAAQRMHEAGYTVDWVCGVAVAPVLQLYPWVHVHVIDEAALLRGTPIERMRAMLALWRLTCRTRYDVAATLYYDARYKLLMLPVRARRKIFLSKTDRAFELLPGRHHTDEYDRILSGRKDEETPLQLAPVPAPNLLPTDVPRHETKARIVLVPAGARNLMRDDALRRWPMENYVLLAQRLLDSGHEVILSGGPGDMWASPFFSASPVNNLIGQMSLLQTLSLLDSADVTVTHDTGPLHLAGITRSAIVSLFGPTDPHGRLPRRSNCVALWGGEGFACRPCYDGRDYAPCPNNGCIQQISPAMVHSEIEALLVALRDGKPLPPRIVVPQPTPHLLTVIA